MTLEQILRIKKESIENHELIILCKDALNQCISILDTVSKSILKDFFNRKNRLFSGIIYFENLDANMLDVSFGFLNNDALSFKAKSNIFGFNYIHIDFYTEKILFETITKESNNYYDERYFKMLFGENLLSFTITKNAKKSFKEAIFEVSLSYFK